MRIWLIVYMGCMLFLFGCALEMQERMNDGGKEIGAMNEQLLQAAANQDTAKVKQLIKEGATLDIQDGEGRTALMIATYNNDLTTARALVDAGADVNIQDKIKNSPFLYAGAQGYLDILKLTIDAGADPSITNRFGGIALIPAAEHGYVEVVKELLTNTDSDVNHINNLGWTALLEAIILNDGGEKQQETIQLLIKHGADVNISDNDGVSPLKHARERGFKEIEQLLLEAGAN